MFYLFAILTALACLVFPYTMYTMLLIVIESNGHKIADLIVSGIGFIWAFFAMTALLDYKELSDKADTPTAQDNETFKL